MLNTIALIIWITLPNGSSYAMPPFYYSTEMECKTAMTNIMHNKDRPPKITAFCAHVIKDEPQTTIVKAYV